METPTPITDSEAGFVNDSNEEWPQTFDKDSYGSYVPVEVARKLEREVIRLQALVDRFVSAQPSI